MKMIPPVVLPTRDSLASESCLRQMMTRLRHSPGELEALHTEERRRLRSQIVERRHKLFNDFDEIRALERELVAAVASARSHAGRRS